MKGCPYCDVKFHSTAELKYHLMIHKTLEGFEGKEKFSSSVALGKDKDKEQIKEGIGQILCSPSSGERPPVCSQEDEKLPPSQLVQDANQNQNGSLARMHKRRKHDLHKPFQCSQCEWKFTYAYELRSHEDTHMQERSSVSCLYCNQKFLHEFTLKRHIKISTKENPFKCPKCVETFEVQCLLRKHVKSHKGEKTFKCAHCDMKFFVKSRLILHKTFSDESPFWCSHCEEKFISEKDLIEHGKIHVSDIYLCSQHTKANANGKQFKCSYCDENFNAKCILKKHVKIHKGDKPFYCSLCDKNFIWRSQLDHHLTTHNSKETKKWEDKLTTLPFLSKCLRNLPNKETQKQIMSHSSLLDIPMAEIQEQKSAKVQPEGCLTEEHSTKEDFSATAKFRRCNIDECHPGENASFAKKSLKVVQECSSKEETSCKEDLPAPAELKRFYVGEGEPEEDSSSDETNTEEDLPTLTELRSPVGGQPKEISHVDEVQEDSSSEETSSEADLPAPTEQRSDIEEREPEEISPVKQCLEYSSSEENSIEEDPPAPAELGISLIEGGEPEENSPEKQFQQDSRCEETNGEDFPSPSELKRSHVGGPTKEKSPRKPFQKTDSVKDFPIPKELRFNIGEGQVEGNVTNIRESPLKVVQSEHQPDTTEAKTDWRILISILIENLEWSLKHR
ncbi:zinc finger protein Xfin-like [Penaeus monodon]|uniref:zinc finger protein Xfin-like n=1 Tax=Penaeus monodon TaxID=6687 RepID=UPI0018A75059|nr:zinc finger protein Xfin-like [Penaeus monodon]